MASPFTVFRKHQKVFLAVLALLAMIAFVFLSGPVFDALTTGHVHNPVVVRTKAYGDLTEADLANLLRQLNLVRTFFERVYWTLGLRVPVELPSEESAIEIWLLANRARELGIVISNQMINSYIQEMTGKRVPRETFRQVLREMHVSDWQLFEAMRTELAARQLLEMIDFSTAPATPAQRWQYYQRLHRRASVELVAEPVAKYVDRVGEPEEATLRDFFEKYKENFYDPTSPEPGFRRPHRVVVEYLKAEIAKFLEPSSITEEQIRQYYEKNKDMYYLRNKLPPVEKANPKTPPPEAPLPEKPKPEPSAATPSEPKQPISPPTTPLQSTEAEKLAAEKKPKEPSEEKMPKEPPAEKMPKAAPAEKTPNEPLIEKKQPVSEAPEKSASQKVLKDAPVSAQPKEGAATRRKASTISEGVPYLLLSRHSGGTSGMLEELPTLGAVWAEAMSSLGLGSQGAEWPTLWSVSAEGGQASASSQADAQHISEPAEKASESAPSSSAKRSGDKAPESQTVKPEKGVEGSTSLPTSVAQPKAKPGEGVSAGQEGKQSEAKPASASSGGAPVSSSPASKYIPLEEVREEIREVLARGQAQAKIEQMLQKIRDQMNSYSQARLAALAAGKHPPKPFNLEALANQYGLQYRRTPLVAEWQLRRDFRDIAQAQVAGRESVIRVLYYQGRPPLQPMLAQDVDAYYLFWKLEDAKEAIPSWDYTEAERLEHEAEQARQRGQEEEAARLADLANRARRETDQLRQEVLRSWKMIQARSLARDRAAQLAALARKSGKPLQDAFAKEPGVTVLEAGPFSWLTYGGISPRLFMQAPPPRISSIPQVELPGEEFMQTVFRMEPGQVEVAFNQPQTVAYVIRLKSFEPSDEVLWKMFLAEPYADYATAAMLDQQKIRRAWLEQLKRSIGFRWERAPRPAAER
ncbi:MAG: SurA N-terminal domain-containing protein [Thermoguttaceae bacterium]|nr:SurA N-terminal domain-containing protein [Thermoguttaceae bacterium]MDW8038964.1 SurA N-terminal domain-containing protein [Thermoguttaceae bacterium]